MEQFENHLRALTQESQAQQSQTQWQQQARELLAAYDERAAAERRSALGQRRMDILTRILESLDCPRALTAMQEAGIARGYKGPLFIRNPEQFYVKVVLKRRHVRWYPFPIRVFEDQIGVRAYDAGSVYIEVAEFRRTGKVWRVAPLNTPIPYAPENQELIQQSIANALVAWAQRRVRR